MLTALLDLDDGGIRAAPSSLEDISLTWMGRTRGFPNQLETTFGGSSGQGRRKFREVESETRLTFLQIWGEAKSRSHADRGAHPRTSHGSVFWEDPLVIQKASEGAMTSVFETASWKALGDLCSNFSLRLLWSSGTIWCRSLLCWSSSSDLWTSIIPGFSLPHFPR